MIPIAKKFDTVIVKQHSEAIINYLTKSRSMTNKKNALEKLVTAFTGGKYTLKTLITASFDKIEQDIVPAWDAYPAGSKRYYKKTIARFETFYNYLSKPEHYWFYDHAKKPVFYNSNYLFKKLEIFICPYCNENYTYHLERSGKRNYDIDHFFSKIKYPVLALSFYNMIPSCKVCNFFKLDKPDAILSPYHNYKIDAILRWGLTILSSDYLLDKTQFEIGIAMTSSEPVVKKIATNVEVFDLENRYKERKDIILDVLRKKQVYNADYIDQLFKDYEGKLFSNVADVKKMIYNVSLNEDEYHQRPFSKLVRDIFESDH